MSALKSSQLVALSASELAWLLLFLVLAWTNCDRRLSPENSSVPDPHPSGTELTAPFRNMEAKNRFLKDSNSILALTNRSLHELLTATNAALKASTTELNSTRRMLVEQRLRTSDLEARLAKVQDENLQLSNDLQQIKESLVLSQHEADERGKALLDTRAKLKAAEQTVQQKVKELADLVDESEQEDVYKPSGQGHGASLDDDRAELMVRSELLGLKGRLESVAFVVDTSQSMTRGGRWQTASQVIGAWVEHLPIRRCRVIFFNDRVETYPSTRDYYEMIGEAAKTNRTYIKELLRRCKPTGETDTLGALEQALADETVDTIILFSDGEPNVGGTVKQLTDRIEELCRTHKDVVVNTVGLGDYFKPGLAQFLLRTASHTGGTFIGR